MFEPKKKAIFVLVYTLVSMTITALAYSVSGSIRETALVALFYWTVTVATMEWRRTNG